MRDSSSRHNHHQNRAGHSTCAVSFLLAILCRTAYYRAVQRGESIEWFGGSTVGQAFRFASTGDAIAVWNDSRIEFYTLGWRKYDQPFSEVTLLNTAALDSSDPSLMGQGAWTPDGRQFAYSDVRGLWLLDVYTPSADPVLLYPSQSDSLPLALHVSPLGRYLQIEQGDERLTLDSVAGDTFPDGLVSPDDRLLLAYASHSPG